MKNKIYLLIVGVFIVLSSINLGSSPGPNLHLNVVNAVREDPSVNDSLIARLINDNFDACLVGIEYADSGIFKYYTEFKLYKQLHSYSTVSEMLRVARGDRDRAFTYCYKLHLAGDGVSHNFYVPAEIRKTKLPNYIIHPIKELKIEGNYLDIRSNRMMQKHEEFDWLVEQATGRDWSSEASTLNLLIGGGLFYEKAYAPDSTTFWGKFQNRLYAIISVFVNDESEVDLRNLMLEESRAVLRGETSSLDPSGEQALLNADKSTSLWLYGGTILLIIIIFILSFRWNLIGFNKQKFRIR